VISDVIRAVELGKQISRKLVRIGEAEVGETAEGVILFRQQKPNM